MQIASQGSVQLSRLANWVIGGWGWEGDMTAEILLQSVLQEATVSSSSLGRDVQSLMCPSSNFLC